MQPLHVLSPGVFRTGSLFKTLWKVDQVYSELCHRTLFKHIQAYSEPYATLAYAETWHTRNPGIFKTLPWLLSDAYSEPCHIYENLGIRRTLTYLKPDTYSELSKMKFFAKIVNYNYFSKALLLDLWPVLNISQKYSLTCRVPMYFMIHIQKPVYYRNSRHLQAYSRSIQTHSAILWHI